MRYASPTVASHFRSDVVAAHRLQVLATVATVTPGADGLAEAIDDLDAIRVAAAADALEARIGHDIAALLSVVRAETGSGLVGYGLTSSNIVDTAQALQLRACGSALSGLGFEAAAAIGLYCDSDLSQVSRTHGRAAERGELRSHADVWESRVADAAWNLGRVRLPGQLAGPTGRYAVLGRDQAGKALRLLGLPQVSDRRPDQAVNRIHVLKWARAVADLATAAAHFATQVRLAATRDEAAEPTGVESYRGSSSMPHKRNPTRSERIVGLERVVRANVGALEGSVVWWDQRDLTSSSVERVTLPLIAELTGYILIETALIAQGLEWDVDRLTANNEALPAVSSNEALWAATVGRGDDFDRVYDAIQAEATIGPTAGNEGPSEDMMTSPRPEGPDPAS